MERPCQAFRDQVLVFRWLASGHLMFPPEPVAMTTWPERRAAVTWRALISICPVVMLRSRRANCRSAWGEKEFKLTDS